MGRDVEFLKRIAGLEGGAVEGIGWPEAQAFHSRAQPADVAKLWGDDLAQPRGLSGRDVPGIHRSMVHMRPWFDVRQQSGFGS